MNKISLLQRKYRKGKTIAEAAEDLEEEISGIQAFYDLIAQYPDEDDEGILARYQKTSMTAL